ncbi:MAG: hypothetical protein HC894_24245 [Microcoleus sp. SM1_3_4]|nr:hypothetical protein [Microcoleus sp. SM1_3_4]
MSFELRTVFNSELLSNSQFPIPDYQFPTINYQLSTINYHRISPILTGSGSGGGASLAFNF